MKGDFSRSTFDPSKRYSGVRMQQGRVLLDADWNEQLDIQRERDERSAIDAVGPSGVPWLPKDSFEVSVEGGPPQVKPGRIYVEGVLCENPQSLMLDAQPDLPNALPTVDGKYLVYIDAWRQHVSALEDPSLREVALGGADTTSRDRLVWQVRFLAGESFTADTNPTSALVRQLLLRAPGNLGTLAARAKPGEAFAAEACMVPTTGGYQRLENALYRVEIHQGGAVGAATYKWSRENGAVAARCSGYAAEGAFYRLTLQGLGRDGVLAFSVGDCVELTTDLLERAAALQAPPADQPGLFATVMHRDPEAGTIDVQLPVGTASMPSWFGPPAANSPELRKVRRWEAMPKQIAGAGEFDGFTELNATGGTSGGDGIEVRFRVRQGTTPLQFYTGDYWLIPARVGSTEIAWPQDGGSPPSPKQLLPHGIQHHYAPLAIVTRGGAGANWARLRDCRADVRFPALTEMRQLAYAGEPLPRPIFGEFELVAAVTNGQWMEKGAAVTFQVTGAEPCLVSVDGTSWGSSKVIETSSGGVATCYAKLVGLAEDALVEAKFEPSAFGGEFAHTPLRFVLRRGHPRFPMPAVGPLLDLDADRYVTANSADKVTRWESSVNQAHVATPGSAPPTLALGAFGGRSVVRFDAGATLTISDALSQLDEERLTLYVVGFLAGGATDATVVGRYLNAGNPNSFRWALRLKSSVTVTAAPHNGVDQTFNSDSTHSWAAMAVWSHATMRGAITCNGRQFGENLERSPPDIDYPGGSTGAIVIGDGSFDLMRVLLYKDTHNLATQRAVAARLAQEYGLVFAR